MNNIIKIYRFYNHVINEKYEVKTIKNYDYAFKCACKHWKNSNTDDIVNML